MRREPDTRERGETHISSLVVHARPTAVEEVARAISELTGAELHMASAEGKLIVSLETETLHQVTATLDAISRIAGVLNAQLVYHHAESPDRLDEIIEIEAPRSGAE